MIVPVATLLIGAVLGYLGQRSRMCFIGGIRDFILVRDTYLLRGLIAFGLTAWVGFPLVALLSGELAKPAGLPDTVTIAITIAGGFGVGLLSTIANGCPFRQHVLAAQGSRSAAAYLLGFFAGAVVFHVWVGRLLLSFLP
jgi:uncharacterized membrane protein YedE/YeeE